MNIDYTQLAIHEAKQVAVKVSLVVIPSEARNPLYRNSTKKADSSGKPRPRIENVRVFPQPMKPNGR
jgi:hypothetical protein